MPKASVKTKFNKAHEASVPDILHAHNPKGIFLPNLLLTGESVMFRTA